MGIHVFYFLWFGLKLLFLFILALNAQTDARPTDLLDSPKATFFLTTLTTPAPRSESKPEITLHPIPIFTYSCSGLMMHYTCVFTFYIIEANAEANESPSTFIQSIAPTVSVIRVPLSTLTSTTYTPPPTMYTTTKNGKSIFSSKYFIFHLHRPNDSCYKYSAFLPLKLQELMLSRQVIRELESHIQLF